MKFRKKKGTLFIAAVIIAVVGTTSWAALHYRNKAVQEETMKDGTAPIADTAANQVPVYTPTPLDVQTPGKAEADITDRLIMKDGQRKAYLTFDDGPSENTEKILDIQKQYDIKATFFVVGKNAQSHPELVKRIFEEGHAIGNHSYNHIYGYMYYSADCFKEEVEKTTEVVGSIIGAENVQKLFRFPGGSFEASKEPYRQMLYEMGYSFVDWNALNGDADGKEYTYDRIVAMFKETAMKHEDAIVLMHDATAKTLTPEALPECIEYLANNGFTFEAIHIANQEEGTA